MKIRFFFRILALLLASAFIFSGCKQVASSPETTEVTQTTTQPVQLDTEPTQMHTIPATEEPGIPQELVQAFSLMQQRLQEGTLRMRIYKPADMDGEAQKLDLLIGRNMGGSQGTTVTVVEPDDLLNHQESLVRLQPELLIPDNAQNEWTHLAYLFETPEDGIILKIGFNHSFLYAGWTAENEYNEVWEYTLNINGHYFRYDAAFYEAVRSFLTGLVLEDYDQRLAYNQLEPTP
ncbi:MAG: hypothetical protein E7459_00715 [Ruminococcaceae bacterium]|nr:hypothetical protein [Oscillospiraceae bacterium]